MRTPKRILLLANFEYGQAGVHLVAVHSLAELYRDTVEVHLASFGPFADLVRSPSEGNRACLRPGAVPSCVWRSIMERDRASSIRPSFCSCGAASRRLGTGPTFVDIFEAVRALIFLASGLPYPLPWFLIPLNACYMLYIVLYIMITQPTRHLKAYVRSCTNQTVTPMALNLLNRIPPPGVKYFIANLPELEFPHMEEIGSECMSWEGSRFPSVLREMRGG
ncbi:uncharacterized protein PG986_005006 [Apiospora aurea]|uniref:Uncharacterized protein n=1 Tax=Apiospora aurea TaxID=335848 RepID=A0ABR1QGQ2_9PEZI